MSLKLWTIGYDGRSTEEIVEKLREAGIERVVHIGTLARDIEGSAFEDRLKKELKDAGIEFEHVAGAGRPPEFRGIAADRGREQLTSAFEAYLSRRSYEVDKLRRKIEERPTALLCYLQGEGACEGAVLVQLLQKQGNKIENL
jgi:uncharacterized protein (DUF488 family)